jgi:hypothetical protein
VNCWTDRAIFDLAKNQIEAKTHGAGMKMNEVRERIKILDDLERGELTVEETIRKLKEAGERGPEPKPGSYARQWWIWPLSIGAVISVAGVFLGIQGGWLWVCAGPMLLLGMVMLAFGVASINAPAVHLRVDLNKRRSIALSLPIPLRLGARLLKRFGPNIAQLDKTALDELILSLQDMDQPLTIDIDHGAGGERVHLHIG